MSTKPFVSFLLFAYKQEKFIREAVRSALSQTYEPLEIILSDDCSPDNTFDIIKEEINLYNGPHKIIINRNENNLGLASHINRVFEMAKGDFFVMAAGDDISVPERTELMVNRWLDKDKPVDLVCSFFEEIDAEGRPTGFVKKNVVFTPEITQPVQKWKCGATGACAGYSKAAIYNRYGPLENKIIAEDWIFSFRAWLGAGIGLIEKPLVKHRTHGNSLSVIYRGIGDTNRLRRSFLRNNVSCSELARAKEWLKAWQLSGKFKNHSLESELKHWVELMELEQQAYSSGRIQALQIAIKCLWYHGGGQVALRLIIRHVMKIY